MLWSSPMHIRGSSTFRQDFSVEGLTREGATRHYNYNRHKYLNNVRPPWFMRNAPVGTRNRIECPSPCRHGNFDGGRWSIIKVAHGVPFLWEIRGRSTCQNDRSCGTHTRERRDFALVFNKSPGLWEPGHGGEQPLPLSTVITGRGTRCLHSALRSLTSLEISCACANDCWLWITSSDTRSLSYSINFALRVRSKSRHRIWSVWLTNQNEEFYKLINQRMLQSICNVPLTVPLVTLPLC